MKKLLLIFSLFACSAHAEGPLFSHKDPSIQQEFDNVYQDFRTRFAPLLGGTSGQFFISRGSGSTAQFNTVPYIVRVSTGTASQTLTNNSTGYRDTGLSASITPKSASNKIVVLVSQAAYAHSDLVNDVRLLRDSTGLGNYMGHYTNTGDADINGAQISVLYFDAPNTTSAVTYKTQFRSTGAGGTVGIGGDGTTAYLSYMILVEIAGL